ncbi:MAG: PA14 domain-containing protein [Limisphaerales bacterium]
MDRVSPKTSRWLAFLAFSVCFSGLPVVAQSPVTVPASVAVSPRVTTVGTGLNGEYWLRPPTSIGTDGATVRANGIDRQIRDFGLPSGTFQAGRLTYTGNDLTPIADWLATDAGSFKGGAGDLDDAAFRFTGYINVNAAGPVQLGTTSDDGSRINIGGLDIVNNDGSHGDATVDVAVNFEAAGLYPIEVTYFNGDWTSDNSPDGSPEGVNHSGNPDPSVHGGANFHLRVNGATVTATTLRMFHTTAPVAFVPPELAVLPPLTTAGGSLRGEYWQRPVNSILGDGAVNRENGVDRQIRGFGSPSGVFEAKQMAYTGNDLTEVGPWLSSDGASFSGTAGNLDDGAFRFTGFLNVTSPGTLNLGTISDDGSRIRIAGIDIINNDGSHGDQTMDTNVNFSASGLYPIEVTYYNGDWTSDNSPDGSPEGVNHSGNPDPSVHGGANFTLRVDGATVTAARMGMFHATAPVALVPPEAAVRGPRGDAGGGLTGEYWLRPPVSILTDGAANRDNGIDRQIRRFGRAQGTFLATGWSYTGNDLTDVAAWLGGDAGSFVGSAGNLDEGAFRFSGYVSVPGPQTINLGTTSDDGSRITVAGLDVVNNDGSHGDATVDGNVNFGAAGLYPIEITYFNGDWTSDNSPDGSPAGVNHSGNPDPSVHGGANFHLRSGGAAINAATKAMLHPMLITRVAETGGDNEATDTIVAQWTGQTFINGVANEPLPGTPLDAAHTVGWLGNHSPAFVDRNHRYTNASDTVSIPSYLRNGEYILSGNDNRDNASYVLDVTVSEMVDAYLLVDNRLGDPNGPNTTPPAFGPTRMQWVLDEGWAPKMTGANRTGDPAAPDEIGIDEGADGTINQWYSVYVKSFPAGTFKLRQADNAGQNMYGVVVTHHVAAPVAATLEIARDGAALVVRFPAGYRLQRAESLTAPISWTEVSTVSPYTIPAGAAAGYFRGISP